MFTLNGFVTLDARYFGFLIPIFSLRGSNFIYAQDLSAGFIINEFMLLQIENFSQINYLPPPLFKNIGDGGIIAFGKQDDVIFGEYEDMKEQIRLKDLTHIDDIFSLVELFSFCEDRNNLNKSISLARGRFSNAKFAESWSDMERATDFGANFRQKRIGITKEQRDAFDSAIDRLIDDAHSENWYRTWRKLWSERPGNKRLLSLAKWWTRDHLEGFGASQVLMTILSDRHRTEGYELDEYIQLSIKWLLNHTPMGAEWGNLWLQAVKGNQNIPKKLVDAARIYIDFVPDSLPEGRSWSRIWRKLRSLTGEQQYLASCARKAVGKLKNNREFVRSVLLDLIRWEFTADWCLPIVIEWLENYERADNSWATAFLAVSEINGFPAWQIGSKWLRAQSNLRSWYKVWKFLYDHGGYEEEAVSIARDWLNRTDTAIGTWPKLMSEVLQSEFSIDSDEKLAQRWIGSRMHLAKFESKADLVRALQYDP